jgi:transcriptional regulator with XRE-family HTH domain
MTYISANLKYLRKKRGLTQQQFADELKIKRSSVGAYEEERAEPKYDLLQQFATYYELSIDELLHEKINDRWKPKPKVDPSDIRVLSITVDNQNRENIELVTIKANAGYLSGYADPEFINELPRFHLPMFRQGTYRGFEIQGDSMLPLQPGTIIIGEYLETWSNLKPGETYIIISKNDGIVYKRVGNKFKENKPLKLVSDNTVYEPYTIPSDEIIEIWKAKAYISTNFPEPAPEPTLETITSMVAQMQKSITDLQKNKS